MNLITIAASQLTGIPEPTLRLLLTLLLAYPISTLYNHIKVTQRTHYILATGLLLNFFFNGIDIIHSLITTTVSYGLCLVLGEHWGDRTLAATAVWLFNAVYLLTGYYMTETDEYDITWTMTQCILCLRLMGFGFDYYDGRSSVESEVTASAIASKPPQALPLSFRADTPLRDLPSLGDLLAYTLFPSAFLVGPQFSFSLFKHWIHDTQHGLTQEQVLERQRAQSVYVWRCLVLSVFYLGLQQTLGARYSTSYLLTEEYSSMSFFKRVLAFTAAGRFGFNKYVGIWLLTEGAAASFGISYEGMDSKGHALYAGLANTLPSKLNGATSLEQVIEAFNVNTNLWSKYYVFKRLRFLGDKRLSQMGTLLFLAVWHGFHAMYFVTFLLEFLDVQCEQICRKRLGFIKPYVQQNAVYRALWKVCTWCATQICVSYAMVGFELLSVSKAITAYKTVYFLGHVMIPVIFIADKVLPKPMALKKKAE